MKTISRYIITEHTAPFFFGIGTILFVFILNVAFRDLPRFLGKGIPASVILEIFFYNMAWILALAVPMSVLISTLMTFGQLSADNEIVAFKASGVHLYRLMAPVFVVAILLTFLMERFNNVVLPEFNLRAKRLYGDISQKKPTASIEANVIFNEIPNYSIRVEKVDNKKNKLYGVWMDDTSDPKTSKTIIAREGIIYVDEADERLILTLFHGEMHQVDVKDLQDYHWLQFDKQVVSIPFQNMVLKRSNQQIRGDREKSSTMMWEDVRKNEGFLKDKGNRISDRAMVDLEGLFPKEFLKETGEKPEPPKRTKVIRIAEQENRIKRIRNQFRGDIGSMASYQKTINKYKVEIYKKYSIPFACIVFVLIGAPMGIMARQGGLAIGGTVSLIFYVIYWSFLIGGEQLADRMMVGPWLAMWSPNIIVGIFGVFLTIYSVRESTFIPWQTWIQQIKDIFTKRVRDRKREA